MTIQVGTEQSVLYEGLQILLANMEPSKVARFWAACHIGDGDYLKFKEELSGQESVESLSTTILAFQESQSESARLGRAIGNLCNPEYVVSVNKYLIYLLGFSFFL